jgi:hypothetical protein
MPCCVARLERTATLNIQFSEAGLQRLLSARFGWVAAHSGCTQTVQHSLSYPFRVFKGAKVAVPFEPADKAAETGRRCLCSARNKTLQ